MRYPSNAKSSETEYFIGKFTDATNTVTIKVYDLSDGSEAGLSASSCSAFASGANWRMFKWASSSFSVQPPSYSQFAFVMTDSDDTDLQQFGKITFGAELDTIVTTNTNIGTPVALDGGAATVGGMLTKMADDSGGSGFDAETDSQEAIANSITAAADAIYNPDTSSTIVTGNQDSGTWASTATNDGTYWDIGDLGSGIEVVCECNLGTNRDATSVTITGYFDSGGQRIVEIYVYNYSSLGYDKLSAGTAATEMRNRSGDLSYVFALSAAHTKPTSTIGEVKIRFLSAQSNNGDTLKLDYIGVTGASSGGVSPDAIANAVWSTDEAHDLKHIKKYIGETYYLSLTKGNDSNSGDSAHQPWKTWAKAVATMAAGDRIFVFADTFTESGIVFTAAGIEVHCEIGATMTGGGGTALRMNGASSLVVGLKATPAANQTGIQMDGASSDLRYCTTSGGAVGFDINGEGTSISNSRAHEPTTTGFDVGASDVFLDDCVAGGSGGATRGFYLSAASSHVIVRKCLSIGNATASFEIASGATYNLLDRCGGDIEPANNSGNTTNGVYDYRITGLVSPGESSDQQIKDVYDKTVTIDGKVDTIDSNVDTINGNVDEPISSRAPSGEYDTEMGYIPSNLSDVATAAEDNTAHGAGAWTTANVSALATSAALATTDGKVDTVDGVVDSILVNTDVKSSSRAPSGEYDTEMGYIPSDLGDVPTDAELDAAHGEDGWETADVSALATSSELSTTEGKVDAVGVIVASTNSKVDAMDILIDRALGLLQENFRITSPVFSSNQMTSCTVKIYPSAADATNDTNEIASYSKTITYDANGDVDTFLVVKD